MLAAFIANAGLSVGVMLKFADGSATASGVLITTVWLILNVTALVQFFNAIADNKNT